MSISPRSSPPYKNSWMLNYNTSIEIDVTFSSFFFRRFRKKKLIFLIGKPMLTCQLEKCTDQKTSKTRHQKEREIFLSLLQESWTHSLFGWFSIQSAFHGSGLTQERLRKIMRFRLRDDCPLWCVVPHASTTTWLCNFRRASHSPDQAPYNPCCATRGRLHATGLGWSPFARLGFQTIIQ
jgi:hypothetical protein